MTTNTPSAVERQLKYAVNRMSEIAAKDGTAILGRAGMDDLRTILAALSAAPAPVSEPVAGSGLTDRFWLIVREPGMVPDRKGPFRHADTAKVLREFVAANPTAYIDHLTIGADGTPDVEHGPLVLQYTDGRSMSVGRKHNERVRAAEVSLAASPSQPTNASVREAAQFLSDRLDDLEWLEGDLEATLRDFMGHVDPAHARLKMALSTPSVSVPQPSGGEG